MNVLWSEIQNTNQSIYFSIFAYLYSIQQCKIRILNFSLLMLSEYVNTFHGKQFANQHVSMFVLVPTNFDMIVKQLQIIPSIKCIISIETMENDFKLYNFDVTWRFYVLDSWLNLFVLNVVTMNLYCTTILYNGKWRRGRT